MKARVASLSLLAIVAVGCSNGSSGGGSNAADTPPPVQTTASDSSTPSASPSSSPKPTPSFSSTVQASHPCKTPDLSVTLGQGQGAAGSAIVPIIFTNTSADACTLYGYPGVSFLDADGNELGVDATHNGNQKAIVTLAPDGTANSLLQMPDPGNYGPGACQGATSSQLRVYPPGDFKALTISFATAICTTTHGWSSDGPVTPGVNG